MLSLADFDSRLTKGCCVITGEGHADRQTLMGKMPYHVMKAAKAKGLRHGSSPEKWTTGRLCLMPDLRV